MRDLPILFSGAMVRALRDDRKTQTRRVATFMPLAPGLNMQFSGLSAHAVAPGYWALMSRDGSGAWNERTAAQRCPYGVSGDRLWVRETFIAFGRWETRFSEKKRRDEWHFVDMTLETGREYRFDGELPNARRGGATPTWWKRPSIHMPRAASRITLEVTGMRVERLQNISVEDCIAEGMTTTLREHDACVALRDDYRTLWDNLNAARGYGWDPNPWVWVVEFRRLECNT